MKVLLYTENERAFSKSGLGKAIKHQMKALDSVGIEWTLDLDEDYDIVHINTYGLKSIALAKIAKKNGKKVVYHAHSTEEDFKNSFILSNQISPVFKKWLISCYNLGDYIITPTPYSKRLLESYGIKKPIKAISNGIELDFFKPSYIGGKMFRKEYKYRKKDKVIVGIGLYLERKGILDFVELAKRLPQYKFIWFGYTPSYAIPNKIREAVKTKLPNLIFAGYVEPENIKKALSGANLYIFPTLEETEGIPIIEACAMKQNALVRDIPVFEDWLIDGKNVYKAKNIDDFEIKIRQILEGQLPSLVEEGYKVAEERDITKIGLQLKEVYEEVLKQKTTKSKKRVTNRSNLKNKQEKKEKKTKNVTT